MASHIATIELQKERNEEEAAAEGKKSTKHTTIQFNSISYALEICFRGLTFFSFAWLQCMHVRVLSLFSLVHLFSFCFRSFVRFGFFSFSFAQK